MSNNPYVSQNGQQRPGQGQMQGYPNNPQMQQRGPPQNQNSNQPDKFDF